LSRPSPWSRLRSAGRCRLPDRRCSRRTRSSHSDIRSGPKRQTVLGGDSGRQRQKVHLDAADAAPPGDRRPRHARRFDDDLREGAKCRGAGFRERTGRVIGQPREAGRVIAAAERGADREGRRAQTTVAPTAAPATCNVTSVARTATLARSLGISGVGRDGMPRASLSIARHVRRRYGVGVAA
jgi:hypothetical protein